MDLSALERSISNLERSLDSLEALLFWMTGLVVAGLIIEYWHEIPEEIGKLREARKFLWKPVCIIAGGVLITVGVSGELAVQFFASSRQSELRTLNHRIEAKLRAEAEDARLKANEADERSKGFDARIAEAKRDSANAESLARKYESQIAASNARAKQADAKAAEAKLELAKLKEPRVLRPSQQKQIAAKVRSFAGQNFDFNVYPESEPMSLATMIDTTLRSAGWNRIASQSGDVVVTVAGETAGTSYGSGVELFISPEDETSVRALDALAAALESEGIPCAKHRTAQLAGKKPLAILIAVGNKPK